MKTDLNQLIPEMKDWNNGKGIDVESWIGCVGDYQKAIGYSTVFWPSFAEVEGCVVRGNVPAGAVRRWIEQCQGDLRKAEATINHLHLDGLHYGSRDISPERLSYLGHVLKEIYECKLARTFPDRSFVVSFDEPDDKEDLVNYILTFYQERAEPTNTPDDLNKS